jgi:cytosine/adenosine deaminase-related metal-dependent hydrolase
MRASFTVRARWILPIDRPPIEGGWIDVRDGHIAAVGSTAAPPDAVDLGDVAVLPGLVNAHTHVELSWLAGRVPPAASLPEWIRAQLAVRRGAPPSDDVERRAAQEAARAMAASGTVLVGDVSNALTSADAVMDAGLGGVIFHEVIGFKPERSVEIARDASARAERVEADAAARRGNVGVEVVAHAPYSVSPALLREVARRRGAAPLSIHLGESPEEIEFLRSGRGPFRDLLEYLGAWTDAWQPPCCDPVEYVHRMGYLQRGMLAVHAVHLRDDALTRLRAAGAVVVTCPRSNIWVGAGMPRVSHFYASGVRVAIGTDSLASVGSLNLFDELAELRRIAPDVSAASLLESATRIGAEALGYGAAYGTISPGKRPALIAVDVPASVADVEEYLVGGVPVSAVRRLDH